MNRQQPHLKAFALGAVFALALLGATAASAQAETTEAFRIEGKNILSTKEIEAKEDVDFTFLTEFNPGELIELTCETFKVNDGLLLIGGESSAKLAFGACHMKINGASKSECNPVGEAVTLEAKGSLVLHGGETYVLFVPQESEGIFAILKFGGTCSLPETVQIKGALVLEDANGPFETEAVEHLVQQAPKELFSDEFKFGKKLLRLDGSAWLKLKGAEAGKKWSANAAADPTTEAFRIEGKNILSTKEIEAKEDVDFTFLTEFNPGELIELTCETFKVNDGLLLIGGESSAKLAFGACHMKINGASKSECNPVGEAVTLEAKGSLVLHGGETYVLFVPQESEGIFAILKFGGTCSLPETVQIKGALVLEDANGPFETEAVEHLVQQAPKELFSDEFKFGKKLLRLDGSAWLKLKGAEAGKKWSANAAADPTTEAFRIEGKNILSTKEIEAKEDVDFTFLTEFNPGELIELTCETFKVNDGLLLIGGESSAKLAFGACHMKINGASKSECNPVGEAVTLEAKGSLVLHGGETYVLFVPQESEGIFAILKFGGTCSLPETVQIKGALVLEDANGPFETEAVEHLVQQAPKELFSDEFKFGKKLLRLDGSAWLKLKGAEAGKKWSARA